MPPVNALSSKAIYHSAGSATNARRPGDPDPATLAAAPEDPLLKTRRSLLAGRIRTGSALLLTGLVATSAAAQDPVARAVRIETPPRIDGVLDEPFWADIPPITGFRQREPVDGGPASEPTEVRIAYNDRSLFFAFHFFDSEPEGIRRNILHRGGRIDKDDRIVIALDTYHDHRNAYLFEVGALGTQDDALLSDEQLDREDWNWDGVFTTETTLTEEGWVLEMEIPFTTIRFPDNEVLEMGIAFQRSIRRKNETVTWPHISQDYRSGIAQVSQFATLIGIEGIHRGRHLEVKPFVTAGAQRFETDVSFDREATAGLDLKYGITPNLTVDFTWNTDFAQVETDNVQINLTRFDLFFPEKREFFLERAGLFQFGASRETEVFFSRRVGLQGDIVGGGRLTGQAGPFSVGALTLRTDPYQGPDDGNPTQAAAWNSVLRLQANLNPRTTVGGIVTSLDGADGKSRRTAGADLESRFWNSSGVRLWGARVSNPSASRLSGESSGGDAAGQAEVALRNDLYTLRVVRSHVGKHFDPALGFVRRPDVDEWYVGGEFLPRFEQSDWARSAWLELDAGRITGTAGDLQSWERVAELGFGFESGDEIEIEVFDRFERLAGPASISGRELAAGDYRFHHWELSGNTNDSRAFSVFGLWSCCGFWDGSRDRVRGGFSLNTGPHLRIGASVARNAISLPVPNGDFTTTLTSLDIQGALNRDLFANALIQWDNLSKELQVNIRIDWIHTPGSDLFLVLDTGYLTGDDLDPRAYRWTRRTAVAKLTWLKAF